MLKERHETLLQKNKKTKITGFYFELGPPHAKERKQGKHYGCVRRGEGRSQYQQQQILVFLTHSFYGFISAPDFID
jgi:hypothetical protein